MLSLPAGAGMRLLVQAPMHACSVQRCMSNPLPQPPLRTSQSCRSERGPFTQESPLPDLVVRA